MYNIRFKTNHVTWPICVTTNTYQAVQRACLITSGRLITNILCINPLSSATGPASPSTECFYRVKPANHNSYVSWPYKGYIPGDFPIGITQGNIWGSVKRATLRS